MKKILLTFIIGFSFVSLYSQKSSPVMGDVATLIDLLKKDYNTVNPDTRDEEINTDRGKVIGIFKSYLEENKKINLNTNLDEPHLTELHTAFDSFQSFKNTFETLSKNDMNFTEKSIAETQKELNKAKDTATKLKNGYYDKKSAFDLNELSSLQDEYNKYNPYLYQMINLFCIKYNLLQDNKMDYLAEKNSYSSIQKSIPFLGGDMAFETIIDGLSRFLAKRIKEELTIHAIDKIKTYLENPTPENYCHELLVLLPTTTNYLKQFDADQLLNFTDELKQYIEQDLNNLLENTVNLKNTPRLKIYIQNNPDLEFAFEGLEIIPQLSKIKSPIDYFELLENSRTLANWRNETIKSNTERVKYNIAQSLRLASMLAYSMTIVENSELKFASVDFIANYGNETNFYFLYFGLLHQQNIKYFDVKFRKSDNSEVLFDIHKMMVAIPTSSVTNTTENFVFLKNNLVSIAKNAEKIYSQGLAIKKKNKNNEEVKYEEIYSFIDDFISFSEEVVTTSDFLLDTKYNFMGSGMRSEIDLKNKTTPYFNVAKIANNVVLDLHQKKYANAIIRAIEIPLNFRTGENGFSNDLLNISNQIQLNNDLYSLSAIFKKETFSDLNDKKKVEKLKSFYAALEVLSIKIDGNSDLSNLKTSINTFNSYIAALDSKTINQQQLDTNIKMLKTALKTVIANDKFMVFVGLSKTKITDKVVEQLVKNGYDITIQNNIKARIVTYLTDKYNYLILGEGSNDDLVTINSIIIEFTPQLLQSNTKITDKKAIKLIHFINDISVSKDAEDVEKAIDAFALPVGSSSLKEKACSYVSLNSFPGILFGNEHSDYKTKKDAFTLGFTAPVGIYIQLKSFEKGSTLGLFIPIIDIAAPVRLRLDDSNDTKTLPDFNFNDIFSPGLYFTYGFKKSPFALNLGGQYGPKLRDIPNDTNTGFTAVDSYRINLGITIDIPLLTLSSKYKD